MQIELSNDEAVELKELLESWLGELRWEISLTESFELREDLKRRRAFVEGLVRRLEPVPA